MRNRFMSSVAVLLVLLACSCATFAQTYGTKGYSPGAWKPEGTSLHRWGQTLILHP